MKEGIQNVVEHIRSVLSLVLGENNLTYKCEMASRFAFSVFEKTGYESLIALGEFTAHPDGETHMWNIVEGIPVDFTISQFGSYQNGIIEQDFYEQYYEIFDFDDEEDISTHTKGLVETCLAMYEQLYSDVKKELEQK